MQRSIQLSAIVIAYALIIGGCGAKPGASKGVGSASAARIIQGVTINEPLILSDPPLPMTAARNETASTVLQLSNLPKPKEKSVLTLRVQPLQLASGNAQIEVGQIKAYQILPMPVDANRAGYVRQTGLKASARTMPRALLPVPMEGGKINVTALRDPSEPLKPNSRLGLSDEPALLWLDVQVPPTAKPGQYTTSVDLIRDGERVESVPLSLTVYDFVLPDERHLQMVGRIEWESLETLYPDLFEAITPQLVSRKDKKYEQAIRLLDQLVALAHEHRTSVVVPRLQPVVKWPANGGPQVDWTDFDTLAEPWLSGAGFADKVPNGYWPLPRIDFLDRYPQPLQMQYWMAAASHFSQMGWMERAWVEVEKDLPGRANAVECIQLSTQAAAILDAHPRLRISLPLEDAQLQFRDKGNPGLINKTSTNRLMTASSGLVFAPPGQAWPGGVARPAHWLRTDLPGLVPYIGAGGDERDVRLWAWLAYLRQSQVIGWDGALPHSHTAQEPADPNELTWFYPGRWFGVDEPVPTIQLKWLRRAQQDFEYLYLAKQRGEVIYSLVMARLMIKPVQTQPNEDPDPTHGLLTGTTDQQAWTKALELLARNILLRDPGKELDKDEEQRNLREQKQLELNLETANWIAPQDKPLQIGRNTNWGWAAKEGNWVDLRLGLDIYNATDQPLTGELQWVSAPRGWEFNPQPVVVAPNNAVNVFQVKQFTMETRVDLSKLGPETRRPIQFKFIDEMHPSRPSHLSVLAPVAASDRREGKLSIDGALGDWDEAADAIQQGPMVVMLDRPSLQRQAMQMASTPSSIYSNWASKHFYVAFKLDGLAGGDAKVGKNTVDYQLRRAWSEDLCEILVQAVYVQPGNVGQVVHLVCRPNGQVTAAIKPSPKNQKLFGAEYKDVLGANVRYGYAVEGSIWRGEVAIPLDLINDKEHQGMTPTLMRFNFVQHKQATGESSSWAGPLDFGRDDSFMGLLYLRDIKAPGMGTRE
ncbi:MAG: hypothetical protein JWN40_5147 [Phycisphaerales bacterium]|nr:hypothetical protein [Phycisphaerales bacterium]